MAKIEDILKLDTSLSKEIEKANARSREIIVAAQKEADKIVESANEEIASYHREKEIELKKEADKLKAGHLDEFNNRKGKILEVFGEQKDKLKEHIIKRILGSLKNSVDIQA